MKRIMLNLVVVSMIIFAVYAMAEGKNKGCATIQDGTILRTDGIPIN